MTTMTPAAAQLPDHTGKPRVCFKVSLSYEQTRLGMAFHEAGHAVLSLAYGIRVTDAEVIDWQPEGGGWGVTGRTGHHVQNTSAWHFAAQCAAGSLAQVEYLLRYGLWTPERAAACIAEHDRELAVHTLAAHGIPLGRHHVPEGGKSWGMVRGMARRKVTHLWREIRTVAHALNERGSLTGDEIAALTGLTNPAISGGAA